MSEQIALDFTPTARTTDIDTSHGAAVIAISRAAGNRWLALQALYNAGEGGMTDFDLAEVTGVQQTSIGVRRGELVKAGYVTRAFRIDPITCDRTPWNGISPTGSPCARWEITPAGRDFVEAMPA